MNIFDVYPLFDIEPVRAEGSFVWDTNGTKYLDFYGGHAVISIGHSHPKYVKALKTQLESIAFYSNSVKIPLQQKLATILGEVSGYDDYNFFLCNSGAEANENALKLASFYTGRKKVVVFSGSFHGRTSAAVAATDDASIIAPINVSNNFIFHNFNQLEGLDSIIDTETCAVLIEGIQGVAGINVPEDNFLQKLKNLCEKVGALLILDEIQSGYGRSGKFFAHQYSAVKPDLITVAKGMGNGFPVGGVLINPKIPAKFSMLGTTFGGNYLACVAAISVLEIIKEENILENSLKMGEYLISELKEISSIKEIRGRGLMIGIEMEYPIASLRSKLLNDFKIFTGSSSNKNTLRLLPALNVSKKEIDTFIHALKSCLGT